MSHSPASHRTTKRHPLGLFGPGLWLNEPMAEAVRKILRSQFQVMVDSEAGSRKGKNIDAVHDMRVATRRMRAAFRLFGSYFRPTAIAGFQKDLRKMGRALGAVRDLDVFNREAQIYLETLPEDRKDGLDPLFGQWERERRSGPQGAHRVS